MTPSQNFCGACGARLEGTVRFCTQCGTPVVQEMVASAGPGAGQITGTIAGLAKTSLLGGTSYYTIIATPARLIVVRITDQMLQEQYKKVAEQAKAGGSGFFGQVFAKMGAAVDIWATLREIAKPYASMDPDVVLRQSPENFAIPRQDITFVSLSRQDYSKTVKDMSGKHAHVQHQYHYHLILTTRNGAFEFDALYDETVRREIHEAFPGRVQEKT